MFNSNCRAGLAAVLLMAFGGTAFAKLPPPTPAQEQAAAEKKAQADAQAEQQKKELTAAMDRVTTHWRERAAKNGWKAHPAVPAAGAAGADAKKDEAKQAATPPIRSEKAGTAPPSRDVKPDNPVSIR
jgi:Tfp pilus assembly protein PilV